ncbi:zinc-binding dehydrogenase [Oceanobacillus sp. 1P07AA]|uniref:zinc-binding dehydrogenase n=1 Tax=Oceanobacillus sp. 1P07AA TaxID=3132293 RepID=UPI0039A46151
MRGLVHELDQVTIKNMDEPTPASHEVVIKLKAAGLNRRDLAIPKRRGDNQEALILGSDGAGVIESIGDKVQNVQVGDEVMINPSLRWKQNSDAPPKEFDILGMPDHGTIAEKIVIASDQVEPKPAYMTWEEAAVFSLAAITGYRAIFTKGKLQPGETVFIPGAGSGVASFLMHFAKNHGARVITTSRSKEKQEKAKHLGADVVLDTSDDWERALKDETIDIVIDSVGKATFHRSLAVLKKGGRFVTFGATTEDVIEFDLRSFFYGQYQLIGTTMGCQEELEAALNHFIKFETRPVVDKVYKLEESLDALAYLKEGKQFGKVAIRIS